ncbi:Endomembrane protein 70-domain-containing protein [Kalaharituber pfeilii]|nr:Endomembrane protein 70-domain-containing protein [Kalaharituber pfeilii]
MAATARRRQHARDHADSGSIQPCTPSSTRLIPPSISRMLPILLLLTLLASCPSPTAAFYLPGVAPTDYSSGAKVPLNVNHLTPSLSKEDQHLRSLISYDYYFRPFHFCQPAGGPRDVDESLGSILFGDRIKTSAFEIHMAQNETCKVLCANATYSYVDAQFVNHRIAQNYNFNWLIDGLPAATVGTDKNDPKFQLYSVGFPLGKLYETKSGRYPVLHNHYDIIIDYYSLKGGGISSVGADGKDTRYRVVGVEVQPRSINSQAILNEDGTYTGDCSDDKNPLYLSEGNSADTSAGSPDGYSESATAIFTYSVYWRPSSTPWATRWDKYLHVRDTNIHWYFLINSTIIVIFLTGCVGMVLLRALRKDIARYNQLDLTEDVQEDSGWKLVHGDVFRSPKNPMLLSIFLGSGAQLFLMTGTTIAFALLGFLSPSNRGSIGTVMVIMYTLLGSVGGYVSACMYKTFHGDSWKRNLVLTPLFIPGIVFSGFILLNFFLIYEQSSGAVPFGTMLALVAIWFIVSVPLSFIGGYFGFKAPAFEAPQIPQQAMYLRRWPSILAGGVLPFGALMVELHLIMNSIWFHKVYYMFGFLFVCYGIMIMTCSAVTVLLIYFLLCSENYHWNWRAFLTAGSTALYMTAYALLYWMSNLKMGGVSSNVVYLGYSGLIGFLAFVLTGSIGWCASWLFVRRIYASIKID